MKTKSEHKKKAFDDYAAKIKKLEKQVSESETVLKKAQKHFDESWMTVVGHYKNRIFDKNKLKEKGGPQVNVDQDDCLTN